MKKEYMKPTTKVVKIGRSMLLAGSLSVNEDTVGSGDVLAPGEELDPMGGLFAF